MTDTTDFTPHGRHLIAGAWIGGEATFRSTPAHGPAHDFAQGTPALVDRACTAAEDAFWSFGHASRADRAALLTAIAEEIEARGAQITRIGTEETGLPVARLDGERGRTCHSGQADWGRELAPEGQREGALREARSAIGYCVAGHISVE